MDERIKIRRELMYHTYPQESICEKLRSIYDSIHDLDVPEKDEITEKLVDAYIMAKKMDERLAYYWTTYHDETGESGGNLKRLTDYEKRMEMRTARKEKDEPDAEILEG